MTPNKHINIKADLNQKRRRQERGGERERESLNRTTYVFRSNLIANHAVSLFLAVVAGR